MEDLQGIVTIRSDSYRPCPLCHEGMVGAGAGDDEVLAVQVNHLLTHEQTRLLHVGQETSRDGDGNPYQTTVAVIGLPEPPPEPPKYDIRVVTPSSE